MRAIEEKDDIYKLAGSLDEQIKQTNPITIINALCQMGSLIESPIISTEVKYDLEAGKRDMLKICILAMRESKLRIFHPEDILEKKSKQDDRQRFCLPVINLTHYLYFFKNNFQAISFLRAANIISSKNMDVYYHRWFSEFETREEAEDFIDDFHELIMVVMFHPSGYLDLESIPKNFNICTTILERYHETKVIAPFDETIRKEFYSDPNSFIKNCNCSHTETNDLFTASSDHISYTWEKIDDGWSYKGWVIQEPIPSHNIDIVEQEPVRETPDLGLTPDVDLILYAKNDIRYADSDPSFDGLKYEELKCPEIECWNRKRVFGRVRFHKEWHWVMGFETRDNVVYKLFLEYGKQIKVRIENGKAFLFIEKIDPTNQIEMINTSKKVL